MTGHTLIVTVCTGKTCTEEIVRDLTMVGVEYGIIGLFPIYLYRLMRFCIASLTTTMFICKIYRHALYHQRAGLM